MTAPSHDSVRRLLAAFGLCVMIILLALWETSPRVSAAPPPPPPPPADDATSVTFTILNTCADNFGLLVDLSTAIQR